MTKGMSERQYATHAGISRGAVQKARAAGRLVLHPDGSIDAAASDARRSQFTDPAKSRRAASSSSGTEGARPVPEAAVAAVGETLREQGLGGGSGSGGTTFLQARTANEVLKAQERRLRLQKLKGELVERDRAAALVFRLAREEREAWITWPARVAALMASELGVEVAAMQKILEDHVRSHLEELAAPRAPDFT